MGYVLHITHQFRCIFKVEKATVGIAMSVSRAPVSIEQLPPTGRFFVNFLNLGVLLKSVEKIEV